MRAPLSIREQSLLNAYWIPINFQTSALLAIAVPAALLRLSVKNYTAELALLASIAAAIAMLVPPVAGAISDSIRRRGGQRRPVLLIGAAINAAGLFWLGHAGSIDVFGAALFVAIFGQSVSVAAYQALIPETVAPEHWGASAGYQGIATLAGSVAGLAVAGLTDPATTFAWSAVVVVAGAMMVATAPEGTRIEQARALVQNWHDFALVFTARFFTIFGLTLLNTFVLFFFHDVLKAKNPSLGTGLVGGLALVGAMVTSFWTGQLSDRVPRKTIVALAGIPMALAAIGFALYPQERWILIFAVIFGLGYGAFVSTGWAIALDSVPQLRDAARDLGIWGIAGGLPGVIAPLAGGWLLAQYAHPLAAYRALFVAAGLCFLAGSVVVLGVRRRRRASRWGFSFQSLTCAIIAPYYHLAYRIRGWGRLPWDRGATLVISNHQHDLDPTAAVIALSLGGPWRPPVYAAASRRMFEPGFMSARIPWLGALLRRFDPSALFMRLGLLPIENELRDRPLASLALSVYRRHGDLPVAQVFDQSTVAKIQSADQDARLSDMFDGSRFKQLPDVRIPIRALAQPYRREVLDQTRAGIAGDLERMERVLRSGATFYLTPEGRYTRDGRLGQLRAALARLVPLAQVYLVAISYDVFVGRRLSMLYRIVPPANPNDLAASLKAARPITLSQLLAAWLINNDAPFGTSDAIRAIQTMLRHLPKKGFVDPALVRAPERLVRAALAKMVRIGILAARSGRYRLTDRRAYPRFPQVDDMLAYQARFFTETIESLQ